MKQPECSTWHKFPNPGGAISTKNVIFPIQGAQLLLKISFFQPRGQDFDQICPVYNSGSTILTKNVILPTPVLNAELGRFCPFSAPRGHTFSTCPPRFPPRVFHGQIFTPDKHKVSAPNALHPKVIQIIRP